MTVNLNKCRYGDVLTSDNGHILLYLGLSGREPGRHEVQYLNSARGTRTTEGFVMETPELRLPTDHNIVSADRIIDNKLVKIF